MTASATEAVDATADYAVEAAPVTQANPDLGQIIFIKRTDPNTGAFGVEPAIVTETYDATDGDWAQNGAVVKLRSFNPDGADAVEQQGPATYDSDDIWNGGYALTFNGPEVESLSRQVVTSPEVTQFPQSSGLSAGQVQAMIEQSNQTLLSGLEGTLAKLLAANAAPVAPAAPADAPVGATGTAQSV